MKKLIYVLLHLLLLLAVLSTPAIVYDIMYKLQQDDLLFIGVPIPFIYAGLWILKIKNQRVKIMLLNTLILFLYRHLFLLQNHHLINTTAGLY